MAEASYSVIGAGIVGLATAREIKRRHPGASVTVIDKETVVAGHQSSHNSGVVHAGLYYAPGSLKARLCARGRVLLREYCAEMGLTYDECGKVVVARNQDELPVLRSIESSATANGVPGLAWLDRSGLADIEPHVCGVAALHSPHTAIVDYAEICRSLSAEAELRLGFAVSSIRHSGAQVVVSNRDGEDIVADRLVICAGLHADRVAHLAGDLDGPSIVAFRGEYWRLIPERAHIVRGLVYPVPDPRYPFLGVHFTPRVDGSVDVGPNAVVAMARQGYLRRQVDVADLMELIKSRAFRGLARKHWRAGIKETIGSLSKRAFVSAAASLVPDIESSWVVRSPAGVRAQAVDEHGNLLDDFCIRRSGPGGAVTSVRNAPSPAATSSLAIAEHIVDQMES